MRRSMPLPAGLAGLPFAVSAAGAEGVSRQRGRAGDLGRPFRGIRSFENNPDIEELCRAYAVRMPASQFFSHSTAAALLGLPLPRSLQAERAVHVTATGREPKARGVIGHLDRGRRVRVVTVREFRVSSPVDTWCALAEVLDLDALVALGDALVRRQEPPATMAQLASAVASRIGRRGVRRLERALELVRPRTDSPRETWTRLVIVRAGLPEPEINFRIVNEYGVFLAWGDLVYVTLKILIEYDGPTHFDSKQVYKDIERLDALMEAGWRVIRLNKKHPGPAVVAKVRQALMAAGWTP